MSFAGLANDQILFDWMDNYDHMAICLSNRFIPGLGSGCSDSFAYRIEGGLRSIGYMKLVQNTADIFGNGPFVNDQNCCDFLIA